MASEEIKIPDDQKGYRCEVILDSISDSGARLTTMLWKYPLMVHAEACRHRAFSHSVGSSRAIPTARIIAMVEQDPVLPVWWGKNQAGMSAAEELDEEGREWAEGAWLVARNSAVAQARYLSEFVGLHKQIANRILAPFQWVTEVVTATDWQNFFALRCHPAAQPEMRRIAEMAQEAYITSKPVERGMFNWHLPFITSEDWNAMSDVSLDKARETLKMVSTARVARTSYRTHEGKVATLDEDLMLYGRLVGSQPIHASPTEHLAQPMPFGHGACYHGNLRGWRSHRFEIPGHTVEG